jgi:hypothetical protein
MGKTFKMIDYSPYYKAHRKEFLGFSIIVVILGTILCLFALSAYSAGNAAKEWPTVTGKIVQSYVTESTTEEGSAFYAPHVMYNYTVNRVGYYSTQITPFNKGFSNPSYASEMVAKYPVGQTVVVMYEPGHPENSLLESDPGIYADLFMIAGLAIIALGVMLAIIALTSKNPRQDNSDQDGEDDSDPEEGYYVIDGRFYKRKEKGR